MKALSKNPLAVDALIVVALLLVAALGYRYSPLLLPRADLAVAADPACDINARACTVALPNGGSVELSVTPRPLPVISPMTVSARLTGIAAERVEIDFAGTDMDMGYNRVALSRQDDGSYSATAALPVCITGRMNWRATLIVQAPERRLSVSYLFAAPTP